MTKDERIQGLIEANNINVGKRRNLATVIRKLREYFDADMQDVLDEIDEALVSNGPR